MKVRGNVHSTVLINNDILKVLLFLSSNWYYIKCNKLALNIGPYNNTYIMHESNELIKDPLLMFWIFEQLEVKHRVKYYGIHIRDN